MSCEHPLAANTRCSGLAGGIPGGRLPGSGISAVGTPAPRGASCPRKVATDATASSAIASAPAATAAIREGRHQGRPAAEGATICVTLASRLAGSRARQRLTRSSQARSRSGTNSEGFGAGFFSRSTAVDTALVPMNGLRPVNISNRTTPSAYTSKRGVGVCPSICSGHM